MIDGDNVRCDCCGTELMARIVGKTLVVRDRRHGNRHVAVIPLDDLLDKAGFTAYHNRDRREVPPRQIDPLLRSTSP